MACLGWLLNLSFAGGEPAVTAGPFFDVRGEIFVPGAKTAQSSTTIIRSEIFVPGAKAGQGLRR